MLHTPKGLTAAQKIRLAHDEVFRRHPIALAAVAAKWKIVPTGKVPTFATNGKEMLYNPVWCDSLTLGQVACVVLHEVCHVVLGHTFRLGTLMGKARSREVKERFNIASDLAINSRLMPEYVAICPRNELADLVKQGCFPRNGRFAEFPELKSAEWYYAELLKTEKQNAPKPKPQPQGNPSQDPGEGAPTSMGEISDALDEALDELTREREDAEDKAEKGGGSGDSDEEDAEGKTGKGGPQGGDEDGEEEDDEDEEGGDSDTKGNAPGEGKGDGGGEEDGEGSGDDDGDLSGKPGNAFGSLEPYATDEEEIEEGEKDFQQAITSAIVTDKSWGTKGSWMETELSETLYPVDPDQERVDWKTKLREFLHKVCRQGFSYRRPSRRHGYRTDVILPAHRGTGNSAGVLIVDTSGSMGDAECNIALRELENILSTLPKTTIKLISCDTRVMEGDTYDRNDFPITEPMTWKGRGGTNLAPAFQWVQNQPRNTFDWCTILSDMEWYWKGAPNPGVPTIWLACRPTPDARNGGLPFGEYIEVVV